MDEGFAETDGVSTSAPIRFCSHAITDIGRVRRQNFLNDPAMGIFGVADGVGGLPLGAQSAQCVIDALRSQISAQPLEIAEDWVNHIHQANERVFLLGQMMSPATGIASTCTCGVIRGAELFRGFALLPDSGRIRAVPHRRSLGRERSTTEPRTSRTRGKMAIGSCPRYGPTRRRSTQCQHP